MAYTRACQPDEIVGMLHKLAEMYRELENKTFLFVSADRKTGEYYNCEITFLPKNFMHLNGFRSKTKSATDFYRDCLKTPPNIIYKTDCSKAYNHDIKTIQAKIEALKELLDLKKAKYFFVGGKDLITEYADFKFAYGNQAIIGFGNISDANSLTNPAITCIPNNIRLYCSKPHKVTFVLEKGMNDTHYSLIYSEAKKGIATELINSENFPKQLRSKIDI